MKIISMIMFDSADRVVLGRLLPFAGTLGPIEGDTRDRLGRHLHRAVPNGRALSATDGEPFTRPQVQAFAQALRDLREHFVPQTNASWWLDAASPEKSGEAGEVFMATKAGIEGIAAGRKYDIENVEAALRIVEHADQTLFALGVDDDGSRWDKRDESYV